MKKLFLIFTLCFISSGIFQATFAEDDDLIIKIPASEVDKINVNYEVKQEKESSFMDSAKDAAKKTVDSTKDLKDKTVTAAKKTKDKTVTSTKEVTNKTVKSTKEFTGKTVDSTKEFIDNINPNKPVTVEELETKSSIKTLKNERNEIKSAYNSRIKDINAKIKAAEASTTITDVQRQNRIYNLNKEKEELVLKRDESVLQYNNKIEKIKTDSKSNK